MACPLSVFICLLTISTFIHKASSNFSDNITGLIEESLTHNKTPALKHYKSYEELKKDFEEMNMNIKTDQEIISDLMLRYNAKPTVEEKRIILEDLEYLLHQVDNAILFADNDWINILIDELTYVDVKTKLLIIDCLSASMQGNSKVKIKVMESKMFTEISKVFSDTWSDLNNEDNQILLSKCLTSIGIFLRNFPAAQWRYFNNTKSSIDSLPIAHAILLQIFNIKVQSKSVQKLKLKSLLLINDMLRERDELAFLGFEDPEKERQYNLVNFHKTMSQYGWCSLTVEHLSKMKLSDVLEIQDSDFIGNWLIASSRIIKNCKNDEKTKKILFEKQKILFHELTKYLRHFEELHSDEWDCSEIIQSIKDLQTLIPPNHRDEL